MVWTWGKAACPAAPVAEHLLAGAIVGGGSATGEGRPRAEKPSCAAPCAARRSATSVLLTDQRRANRQGRELGGWSSSSGKGPGDELLGVLSQKGVPVVAGAGQGLGRIRAVLAGAARASLQGRWGTGRKTETGHAGSRMSTVQSGRRARVPKFIEVGTMVRLRGRPAKGGPCEARQATPIPGSRTLPPKRDPLRPTRPCADELDRRSRLSRLASHGGRGP